MNVVILLGSIRTGRASQRVAYYLRDRLLAETDIHVHLLDLAEQPLPLFQERWQKMDHSPQELVAYGHHLAQADAMLFVSPEYHGSYTGVLKNAIDHYWEEFRLKPIGVVATGSGRMGGINASTEMQQLVLSLGAFPLPQKLVVPYVREAFDADNQPHDAALGKQADRFLQEFLWFSRAITYARQQSRQPIPAM
ncbi:MAG: FMN-dependent NADPH-azoreductase [Bacteroidia bacterium]